jgi:hypothetical protein
MGQTKNCICAELKKESHRYAQEQLIMCANFWLQLMLTALQNFVRNPSITELIIVKTNIPNH